MNCREALCLSSLYLCKGIFLKGCSNLIFFRILNSEFSSCQGRAISNIWWNLSLTIWSWLSESQNKSLLLFGKPKVGFYNSFHYVSLSSIKSNRSFFTIHTEFFGFYKNYSLFVDVFFVNVLPDIETENFWFVISCSLKGQNMIKFSLSLKVSF